MVECNNKDGFEEGEELAASKKLFQEVHLRGKLKLSLPFALQI